MSHFRYFRYPRPACTMYFVSNDIHGRAFQAQDCREKAVCRLSQVLRHFVPVLRGAGCLPCNPFPSGSAAIHAREHQGYDMVNVFTLPSPHRPSSFRRGSRTTFHMPRVFVQVSARRGPTAFRHLLCVDGARPHRGRSPWRKDIR